MHSLTTKTGFTFVFNSDLSGQVSIIDSDGAGVAVLEGADLKELFDYVHAGGEEAQPMLPLYPGRSDEPEATDLAHMVNPCDCDQFPHYHSRGPGCE